MPHSDALLTIAENLLLVSDFDTLQLIGTSTTFQCFLSHLHNLLLAIQNGGSNSSQADATTIARAISRVALANPRRTRNALSKFFSGLEHWEMQDILMLGSMELVIMLSSLANMSCMPFEPSRWAMFLMVVSMCPFEACDYPGRHSHIRGALYQSIRTISAANIYQSIQMDTGARIWFDHCVIIAACKDIAWWDLQEAIYGITTDVLLAEGVEVDNRYLACALHAMLAVTKRAARSNNESLNSA
ncbi:hypothetical protein FRB94_012806 [Tulasnella sp. JGI-2019a]|nr:hypothetical protein FRB94_012806 [Tulasnella sp. JGI-2019a]KAG9018519.1 hypothetical protein FRB93_000222 [Tulasnella sp. JGI-2019a]KAG9037509.1 hypothetical protein FRB95_005448 [Tulasnella sp. JGI-2019a]